MSRKYFVTAIGNAIVDVLSFVDDAFLEDHSLKKGAMTLVDKDNALFLSSLKYHSICSGGSAANTIVTMANFDIKNAFIGNVGDGNYGNIFHQDLDKNGVDFYCNSKTKPGTTARSFVLISPDGERTMCTYLGQASSIEDDINQNVIADSEFLYIEGYLWDKSSVIVALKQAINIAKDNNVKLAMTLSDSIWVKKHRDDFLELLLDMDIVFANEEELKSLILSDHIDYDKIRRMVAQNSKLILVITRSEKGAIVFDAQNDIFYEIPTNAVDVVDATGAGDAFAAGFLYGIKNDLSVQECARIGNIFAGFIIKKVGSRFEQEELQQLQKQVK